MNACFGSDNEGNFGRHVGEGERKGRTANIAETISTLARNMITRFRELDPA